VIIALYKSTFTIPYHEPGSRLLLLSARPAITLTTLKRAAANFAAW